MENQYQYKKYIFLLLNQRLALYYILFHSYHS
ncbi:hypothetical protein XBFFR1_2440011 [Xenorhabdus bovienii str. feltiae France]|nr:hypothetical protein XBFFR1_2440011 [Xenorhabdus bovienii str. feltiae France]